MILRQTRAPFVPCRTPFFGGGGSAFFFSDVQGVANSMKCRCPFREPVQQKMTSLFHRQNRNGYLLTNFPEGATSGII